jgi:hypothetical protein
MQSLIWLKRELNSSTTTRHKPREPSFRRFASTSANVETFSDQPAIQNVTAINQTYEVARSMCVHDIIHLHVNLTG